MSEEVGYKKYSFNFHDDFMKVVDEVSTRLKLCRTDTIELLCGLGREYLEELLAKAEKIKEPPFYVR
jgi:hypothetical protein